MLFGWAIADSRLDAYEEGGYVGLEPPSTLNRGFVFAALS